MREITKWLNRTRADNEEQFNTLLVFLSTVGMIFLVVLLFAFTSSFKPESSKEVLKEKKE